MKNFEPKNKWIAWNTGRTYTEFGQRCAAVFVEPNGILFADFDRSIEYYLPDCPLDVAETMRRYDANDRTEHRPPSMGIEQFAVLRDWLLRVAKNQTA